jgi:hypothetical protein
MQAGVDLPQYNFTVLYVSSSRPDSFCVRLNPTGAVYVLPSTWTTVSKIPDSNAVPFMACNSLVSDSLSIDSSLSIYSISSVDTEPSPKWDTIRLGSSGTFLQGSTIYGYKTVAYFKNGNILCSNTDTVAENIDSLNIIYWDKSRTQTTTIWDSMYSADIYVRARSSLPDPRYRCPGFNDGYHRLHMSTQVRFRNKS